MFKEFKNTSNKLISKVFHKPDGSSGDAEASDNRFVLYKVMALVSFGLSIVSSPLDVEIIPLAIGECFFLIWCAAASYSCKQEFINRIKETSSV